MTKTITPADEKAAIVAKIDRLRAAGAAIDAKDFQLLFYTPDAQGVPSGAIIEIYQLAATLRRNGYEAVILTEEKDYQVPTYLDEDLQALPHQSINGGKLVMKPEDVLVIPEYFISVIRHTANLPCTRVVLVQGYDNAVTTTIPGTNWGQFGIRHVWTMSEPLTKYVREVLRGNYTVQTLRIGIPEYFQPAAIKDPIIAVQVRNAVDLTKISREFYLLYPELRWVGFEPLTSLDPNNPARARREYAELLGKASVVLWVDRIAAFGQTAVEAMACNTPLVALVPDHDPEYLTESNAVWVNRLPEMANMLGRAFKLQLENGLPESLVNGMTETAAKYTPAAAEEAALRVLSTTLTLRQAEIKDLVLFYEGKAGIASAEAVEPAEEITAIETK